MEKDVDKFNLRKKQVCNLFLPVSAMSVTEGYMPKAELELVILFMNTMYISFHCCGTVKDARY